MHSFRLSALIRHRAVLVVGAIFLLSVAVFFRSCTTKVSTQRDPPYELRFLGITYGTNHTVYVGDPSLARINAFLMRRLHVRPIGRRSY